MPRAHVSPMSADPFRDWQRFVEQTRNPSAVCLKIGTALKSD